MDLWVFFSPHSLICGCLSALQLFINSWMIFPLITQTSSSPPFPSFHKHPEFPLPSLQEEKPKNWRTHFEISFSGLILQLQHKPLCKLFKSMENFWGNCHLFVRMQMILKTSRYSPITNLWFEKSNLINLLPLFFSSLL